MNGNLRIIFGEYEKGGGGAAVPAVALWWCVMIAIVVFKAQFIIIDLWKSIKEPASQASKQAASQGSYLLEGCRLEVESV
jgi:hypothetical protein